MQQELGSTNFADMENMKKNIQDLQYLPLAIKETFRMHSPGQAIIRTLSSDFEYKGNKI
jgi:cytochrome P450